MFLSLFLIFVLILPTQNKDVLPLSKEVTFTTQDGITIYGDLVEIDKSKPIILLLHQGRSNARGEYRTIIPELTKLGYNTLSIDQRRGGDLFESTNRTLAKVSKEYSYCEAYQDLEAALEFISSNGFTGSKIVWGSSYSATLAIRLGFEHPETIDKVLAFSPASGGPMADCKPDPYLENLKAKLLVLRPSSEMEIESVKAQYELVQQHGHEVYTAEKGTHGSSMLVQERVEGDARKTWEVVMRFLEK